MPQRYRLTDLDLDFVSLVASGDDPMAQVVIAKTAPATNKSTEKDDSSSTLPITDLPEEINMGDIKKDDLDPEVLAYVEGLETEVTTLAAQVEKAEADLTEKDALLAKSAPIDTDAAEKAMLEKADPALRSLILKQQAEVKEAKEIAKAERDQRLDREFVSKAEALPMLTEDKATLAGVLRRASEALSPEDSVVLDTVLKSANEAISKGNLFASFGAGGSVTTVSKSVDAAAGEIRKAHPDWTTEQCEAEAYRTNPALLAQAMTEG